MKSPRQHASTPARSVRSSLGICAMFVSMTASLPAELSAHAFPTPSCKGADFQSWDEMDALTRLTSHLDITWIVRGRFSTDQPSPAHYVSEQIGTLASAKIWCLLHLIITARAAPRPELSDIGTSQSLRRSRLRSRVQD